ncbi:putative methanol dehydrogenase regulatory protein [Candidatus Competibacter denitrificans Run_A_D11]|uniref:Methanol dehydrogenase regulatory protein n=1 Tax=Candidatus Competibacter denitrificans Run_A_D11 TaxID=1400863 RepID=W6M3K7_9GAMM|nr:putative methanol dehydrogenase regulatory protein [Candidatus Competibacter denitrificans Run_A_D11]HAS85396.1 MoxR family ATPase [Candidatus Competibacteraceae bacterium]
MWTISNASSASCADRTDVQAAIQDPLELAIRQVGSIILGKESTIRLAVACLLARGHLLIEDLPGMGKTTLAHALAHSLGLHYQRIQFTSDLLPADILGAAVYERQRETFVFHPGPIFAQLILADEINRATPKTQSALLEAMEEGQVTIEGETRPLPQPFFVIATQNPAYQIGTFPLPESQLDRFLMRVELGYPDALAERALLEGEDRRDLLARLPVAMTPTQLHEAQAQVNGIHVAPPLLDYVQALLAFSRQSNRFRGGLSPRAGLGLLRAARAWALLHRRGHVLPEDVQAVLPPVVSHRLHPGEDSLEQSTHDLVRHLLTSVALPA